MATLLLVLVNYRTARALLRGYSVQATEHMKFTGLEHSLSATYSWWRKDEFRRLVHGNIEHAQGYLVQVPACPNYFWLFRRVSQQL